MWTGLVHHSTLSSADMFAYRSVDLCINITYLYNILYIMFIFIQILTFLSVFYGNFLILLPCFPSA